jgi:hypothetical protein
LKLLLDEHIWPGVADLVRKLTPTAQIESLHHHSGGRLLNTADDEILTEAYRGHWTFVTFDVNTIPRLLREKAMAKEDHSGVIFISAKSFAQNDHNGLARALASVVGAEEPAASWTNRVVFLGRSSK